MLFVMDATFPQWFVLKQDYNATWWSIFRSYQAEIIVSLIHEPETNNRKGDVFNVGLVGPQYEMKNAMLWKIEDEVSSEISREIFLSISCPNLLGWHSFGSSI